MSETDKTQTFSFETVACLLAVLEEHKVSLGGKHYELMAKLDGKHSHHSFQHQFRKVKSRAKELQVQLASGKASTPSAKSTPAKKASTPNTQQATGKGKKRASKIDVQQEQDEDDEDDDIQSPTKKIKTEAV